MKTLTVPVNGGYCFEYEEIDKFGFGRLNSYDDEEGEDEDKAKEEGEETITFEKLTHPTEQDVENELNILFMEHWDQTDPDFCHFSALILTDKAFEVHMEESSAELVDYDVMQIEFMPDFNFTVLDDISKMLKRIEPDKFQDRRTARPAS
ncbi:MAG TPA: hypothetical protein VK970_16895 [Candidatus Methylacidiphilales bacterium]|nr:hypothetical protein [Candidatus Methylacidiphilales bacterium]